uniref:Endonuclease VIII-like 1 DNA binding domain-containing protein n=1 Tax=Lates calcarifer TaxID=8187 RepID=A0A4W6DHV5_LATCA
RGLKSCIFFFFLRLSIPPFMPARTVLEGLEMKGLTLFYSVIYFPVKCLLIFDSFDDVGGKGYDPAKADYSDFEAWLQCYCVDGMKSIRDHNGRTMWFKGDPGPMAPKVVKQETMLKTPKKREGICKKEAGSKRRKKENTQQVNTPQRAKRPAGDRRKSSSAEPTSGELLLFFQNETTSVGEFLKDNNLIVLLIAGSQRRSCRVTRLNSK